MPGPWSRTSITACAPLACTQTSMRRPCGVYLKALPSRLVMTCSKRVTSPSTQARPSSSRRSWPRDWPVTSKVATTRSISAPSSSRRWVSRTLPEMTRPTSSRSSIRCARCRVWRPMMRRALTATSAAASTRLSTSTAEAIAPSGLRSSWPSMARNSSLARLAASAWRRAACSASTSAARSRSALFCWLMSRLTPTSCSGWRRSSKDNMTRVDSQCDVPSGRSMQHSKVSRSRVAAIIARSCATSASR